MKREIWQGILAGLGIAAVWGVVLLLPLPVLADYYRYTDDTGTVCITNKLANVPAKYRKRMKVVKEAALSAKDTGAKAPAATPAPVTEAVREENVEGAAPRTAQPGGSFPWLKAAGFVAASVAGLYGVTKAAGTITSPLLARMIYLAFFFGIFIFAYKSYADSLVTNYFSIKEKVLDMFRQSNVRESSELDDGAKKLEDGR